MLLKSYVRRVSCSVCFLATALLLPFTAHAQKVPAGFKAELVYKAPDIEHPSAVTCDDEGNLFVAEDPMDMRGPSTDPIDRIILVRWDKKSGKPVKTVFAKNLSAVFGMLWLDGALYVIDAPHYTKLQDTNGDGVADVRKRLADGLGHRAGQFGLNNHVPSGMRLGLDGMVYVSVGDKGIPKARGADGSTITLEGGGVFRMRPDGSQLEIVSSGTRNHMDVALDRLDNIFAYGNDDDFGWWTQVFHHVPTARFGYPYDRKAKNGRYLPPVAELGTGTSCGGACYREAAWPAKYRGAAFFCDWGKSKIERFVFTKKGASFELAADDFMLGDGLKEFRPIDLCFSPDGRNMYIADWNIAAGGRKDRVGRLFRVSYVGDQKTHEPSRGKNADPLDAQLRALDHPAPRQRSQSPRGSADRKRASRSRTESCIASGTNAMVSSTPCQT